MKVTILMLAVASVIIGCTEQSGEKGVFPEQKAYEYSELIESVSSIEVPDFTISTSAKGDILLGKDTSGRVFPIDDFSHLIKNDDDLIQVIKLFPAEKNGVQLMVAEADSVPPYYDENSERSLWVSYEEIVAAYEKSKG